MDQQNQITPTPDGAHLVSVRDGPTVNNKRSPLSVQDNALPVQFCELLPHLSDCEAGETGEVGAFSEDTACQGIVEQKSKCRDELVGFHLPGIR